jgi:hypothetical protein
MGENAENKETILKDASSCYLKDADPVVQRLAGNPLAVGGGRDGGHAVHAGVRNVLHVHGDVPLPDPHGLVVGGGHKPTVLVHKGDRVDSRQMSVIFLRKKDQLVTVLVNQSH